MTKYRNPVIPGFYPDPSICRVDGHQGTDFYLANSSFEYFPGIPIFHSRDLVHWRQISHALTRASQLPLTQAGSSGGLYAPTLRYHQGRFYLIVTNVSGYGHFIVHTDNLTGEWSDPIRVEGSGFDPDLFFDDDGSVYMARHADDFDGIRMWKIDIHTGKFLSEEYKIWPGFDDDLCEAPHIYKINGWYYLLLAEGGTHRGHMATVGRSRTVTGPYESCPYNPILSHRAKVAEPIQATGHADLVQAGDGSWWAVFLGIRQTGWRYHHLGRETFLAPVHWTEDGWPVINTRTTAIQMEMETHLPQYPWEPEPVRDDFDASTLALQWNFRKQNNPGHWSLSERPGWLALHGPSERLSDFNPPAFIGRRQCHFNCTAQTLMEFDPQQDGEEAGLTAFMDESHHYALAVRRENGVNQVIVIKRIGELEVIAAAQPIASTQVLLRIQAEPVKYTFSYAEPGGEFQTLSTALPKYLSSEVAGGFTGVYFAMYAAGANAGQPARCPAYFDWFDYLPQEDGSYV
jgi:xylan 1,4-beta-xylosidase